MVVLLANKGKVRLDRKRNLIEIDKMNKFKGAGIALVTPFNEDDSIDYVGLKNLINYVIEGGATYLVSLGSTGESATLDRNERKTVLEYTAEIVNKRVPLIAGIGGNVTHEVVKSLKQFSSEGFDAILSVSPYYNKPSQDGIYKHYKAVSEASSLPIILYNVPSRTGSNITSETTLRLAHDFKNIIGIKEASGNFDQFNEIIRDKPHEFLFISGDDAITLPLIAMGAVGVISVIGNVIPQIFSTMVRLCLEGKFTEAQPLHYKMIELTRLLFLEGNPAGVKAALRQFEICGDHLRLPLTSISKDTFDNMAKQLRMFRRI